MHRSNRRRMLGIAGSTLGLALLVWLALLPVIPTGLRVDSGEVSTRTIRAPRDINFTSQALTQQRQEEAASAVKDSYVFDPSVAAAQQAQLSTLLGRLRSIVNDPASAPAARSAALAGVDKLSLSPSSLALLQNMTPADFNRDETEARRALASIFDQSLSSDLVSEMRERATNYVSSAVDRDTATLIAELIRPFIVSNLVVDKGRTDAAKDAARAGIPPVQVAFAKGQVIVERDSPVTPETLEALKQTGLVGATLRPAQVGASAVLAVLVAVMISAGLQAFRPITGFRQRLALALAITVPVFIMKIFVPLVLPDDQRHFLAYVLPVSAASMVLAGLIGADLALLAASLVALLSSFAAVLVLDVTVVGLAGTLDIARIALVTGVASFSGVLAVRNAERLAHFLLGGLCVGVSVVAVLIAVWLVDPERALSDLPWIGLVGGINGVLSAFLSAGIFVTLGSVFGVLTKLQLLEMSQLSQPLMLRLQDEAPSTFQHSVIVANLAEKGAHVIGADSLLARVGCYYHDIGKLQRPGFFIENQLGGANPHDALDPSDSARVISDHVTDGLALAKQYKLPAKVAAFIPEHHGTRMVTYFYRRAAETDPDVDPDAFRYPGPKPQSRETAIAMLADSCEASVRANPDHSTAKIDAQVDEIFQERLSEGQLDESDLTLRNIRDLAASFKATLRAVYHPRVEYPRPSEAEMLMRRGSNRSIDNGKPPELPAPQEVTSNR